jgi:phosphoglycolate phosphatase
VSDVRAQTVLWDLDGTLVDPKVGITECIRHAMRRLGRAAPEADDLHWCIGPPLQGSFAALLETDDEAQIRHAVELYRERYRGIGITECLVYPGIPGALSQLKAAGSRLFVATSKPTVFAETVLENAGLRDMFDRVFGSELTGERSHKAELLAHCLQELRIDACEATMVGDREHDVIGARSNGIRCIGALYGYGSEEELSAAGAAALARGPVEIPGLWAGLTRKNPGPA